MKKYLENRFCVVGFKIASNLLVVNGKIYETYGRVYSSMSHLLLYKSYFLELSKSNRYYTLENFVKI